MFVGRCSMSSTLRVQRGQQSVHDAARCAALAERAARAHAGARARVRGAGAGTDSAGACDEGECMRCVCSHLPTGKKPQADDRDRAEQEERRQQLVVPLQGGQLLADVLALLGV